MPGTSNDVTDPSRYRLAVGNEKWLAYYDAQTTAERARLNVLRQSGTFLAALK